MAPLKQKGNLAELKVAADLVERGYQVAFPYGEDVDFDLIAIVGDDAYRVQVKYARSDGRILLVRCRSSSLTNGRVRQVKRYTAKTIDCVAVWDAVTEQCFYVPAEELGAGMNILTLRLAPARNNQRIGIRHAADYRDPPFPQSDAESLP